jgi:hypothetical protein
LALKLSPLRGSPEFFVGYRIDGWLFMVGAAYKKDIASSRDTKTQEDLRFLQIRV